MSPFQSFSPSEGCVIPPAQRDLAARSLRASVSLPRWTYYLSFSYIPAKIVVEIKGSMYTEVISRMFSFLKLQPWLQTCSDCKFQTKSVCMCVQLVFILAAIDLLVFIPRGKRNLALIESQKSHQQRVRDEDVSIPSFTQLH